MKTNKLILIGLSVLAGILLIAGVYGVIQKGERNAPPALEGNTVDSAEEENDDKESALAEKKIAVPGADLMIFKADQKKQTVNLYNPEKNSCYFKISLLLEDGTLLYQSDLIAPGKGIEEIEILRALPGGNYENAILKYECFAMDQNNTPLNGAEFSFTIQSTQ